MSGAFHQVQIFAPLRGDVPGHIIKIEATLNGRVVGVVTGAAEVRASFEKRIDTVA